MQERDKITIIGNAPYVVSKHALGSDGRSNVKIAGSEENGYYIAFELQDDKNKTLTLDEVTDKIVKDLNENGSVLKDYISKDEEKQKVFLKKLIRADIYTKYPKFNDNKDTLQGCIKIVKNDENKTEIKYKPYEDFKKMISEKNSEIMGYYSLNDDGNLVLASKNEIDGEVQISENTTQIDLRKIDNKYALSFDYLWALLVSTGDIDFVENIIKLVLKSEIEITVFEEKTTITTYTRTTYTETHTKVATFENKTDTVTNREYYKADPVDESKEEKSEKTTITITNKAEITKSNIWFAEYKQNFKAKETTSGSKGYPGDNELQNMADVNEETVNHKISEDAATGWYESKYKEWQNEHGNGTINLSENVTKSNYKYGSNTYIEQIKYEEEPKEIKEKTDKTSDTENFVTYLVKSKKALDELKITDDWLYEMLEGNERADYMIDVTKYLMYKATGRDYGVTEKNLEDMVAVPSSKFVSTSGTGFWWPIGSKETTEKDGKIFACGDPALTKSNISRAGKEGSKYNGWDNQTHEKGNNGAAVDIAANGMIGEYYTISMANGTVIRKDDGYEDNGPNGDNGEMGNCVYIEYENRLIVRYMHMSKNSIQVEVGDIVTYGQVIGRIGNSGGSYGAHLHVDGMLNQDFIDITEYLDPDNPRPQNGGNGVNSKFYDFLLLSEGGSQYITENGEYKVFNNGVDSNLELTCGCAIGTLDGGKYCSGILSDSQYRIGAIVTLEQYQQIFDGKVSMRAKQLDKAIAMSGVTLEQYQYDAIMSFLWQFGHTEDKAYTYSTEILNAYKSAGDGGFKNYINNIGGEYSTRREREYKLFSTGDY